MSVSNGERYSIWLKPEDEVRQALKKIIADLSKEYGAPVFDPHVTVAGGIHQTPEDVKEVLQSAAAIRERMTLHLTETDYLDSLYQSLFVKVAPNESLFALREHCLSALNLEHRPYLPHVSLIYKKLDVAEKERIIASVGRRFDYLFTPKSLFLVRTSGSPETWEEVMSVPFQP
ncbi:2'-5' RNA ligase family protein [Balneolales bacterium ANBcel1]|nr:2'-5' RNA ligase family protein [Balneolales bacterium ANBcel1]